MVCDYLLCSFADEHKDRALDIAASRRQGATVRFLLTADLHGKIVLIIDDLTETGERTAVDYMAWQGAVDIETGVFQHKTTSSFVPDFCAEIIREWRWITYPWAAHKDLVGFTEKVLSDALRTIEDIRTRLKERYNPVMKENRLEEVLDDLIRMGTAKRVEGKYRKI